MQPLQHAGQSMVHGASQSSISGGMMMPGMSPGGGTLALPSNMPMMQSGTYNPNQGGMWDQYGGNQLALQNAPGMQNMQPGGQLALYQPGMEPGQSSLASMSSMNSTVRSRSSNYEPGRQKAEEDRILAEQQKPIPEEKKVRGLARAQKPLDQRIASHWDREEVLYSLDHKIEQYSRRHGGVKRLKADRRAQANDGNIRQKELAILDKMRKDEEAGALRLPVEEATEAALRTGFREYVDYAVDEVERFTHISKTGAVTAEFDWSSCGDFHDVPALRRDTGKNRVDGPPSHVPGLGHGSENMFTMDFLRDFCSRSQQAIPDDLALQRMQIAAQEMRDPQLRRADNGAPLWTTASLQEEEELSGLYDPEEGRLPDLSAAKGPFRDREWDVQYSVV